MTVYSVVWFDPATQRVECGGVYDLEASAQERLNQVAWMYRDEGHHIVGLRVTALNVLRLR